MTTGNPPYKLSIEVDATGDLKKFVFGTSDDKHSSTTQYTKIAPDKYIEVQVDAERGQRQKQTPEEQRKIFTREEVLKKIEEKLTDKKSIESITVFDPRYPQDENTGLPIAGFDNSKKDLQDVQKIVDKIRKAPLTAAISFKDILEKGNSDVAKEEPKIGQLKAPSLNVDFKNSKKIEEFKLL